MFDNPEAVQRAVRSGFGGRRLLVVGDLMLDRYLWGQVLRISPEAPVPVVHLTRRTHSAGGAANVARNLAALGLEVQLAGVTGDDEGRAALLADLAADGIRTQAVATARDRATTVKTRVIGNHQQMLRIDEESNQPLDPRDESALCEAILPLMAGAGALVLSDYAKGVLSEALCRRLLGAARALGLPVLVDPKGQDFTKYAGASLVTPNRAELSQATGVPREDLAGLLKAAATLRGHLDLGFLVLTLSELGLALVDGSGTRRIPALAREVFDVSGAGDTVIAIFAAGLAAGLGVSDTAHLANLAAGVVVGKVGTVPINLAELLAAITGEMALEQAAKILDPTSAQARVQAWQAAGERVVFTNGCFDLLHVGHVSYLELARRQGQRLVVGLNTDASVRALKGPERPLIGEQDRARVLAALAAVDAVVLFDAATPLELILALHPDVLAKGADYREEEVVGAPEVKSWGGQVVLIPLVDDHSTTGIIQRLGATGVSPVKTPAGPG
ncbi:MAG: D-glycero-beta-D-manno-heptose-7-phosphate kinase [Chromatiaceae bacterium]